MQRLNNSLRCLLFNIYIYIYIYIYRVGRAAEFWYLGRAVMPMFLRIYAVATVPPACK